MKIIEVTWHDITSYSSWYAKADAAKLENTEVRSVGYLLNRGKKDVRIAMSDSRAKPGEYGVIKVIPRGTITNIREVSS